MEIRKKYKFSIVVITMSVLLFGSILLYPEAITIMKGDYILSRWIGVIETNKSWFLVFFLAVVGGCLAYIVWRLPKVLRKRRESRKSDEYPK